MKTLTRAALILCLIVLGCDSSDSDEGEEHTGVEENPTGNENPAENTETPAVPEEPETYEPGSVGVRVVNLLADNVDIYVRTTGRVRAFPIQDGLAGQNATDFVFPPVGGDVVVTTAGAGDATCVMHCEHFITRYTPQASDGNTHTLLLYTENGEPSSESLWENAPAERVGTYSNAIGPPDPAQGSIIVSAGTVEGFLRVGFQGVAGCQQPTNQENNMIGGTQRPVYVHDPGTVEVLLYDRMDDACAAEPVGGPFSITAQAGERTHLVLYGTPIQSFVLPMSPASGPTPPTAE